jgi:hypothetical protein
MSSETTNLSPWTVVAHGSYFDSSEIEHLVKSLVDSLNRMSSYFTRSQTTYRILPPIYLVVEKECATVSTGCSYLSGIQPLNSPDLNRKKPSLPQQDLVEGVAGDSPLISTFGKPQP